MSQTSSFIKELSSDESAVMRCALYFSLFNYPLREHELLENSAVQCGPETFRTIVRILCENELLTRSGEFYLVNGTDTKVIKRRQRGNSAADAIMGTARYYSKRIAAFPFVRGVFLSGALSKNYYDEKGDVDYFVVTEPGRLWICRTLLILRYKLLPASKKKFWCVNYFVSADALSIPDRNIFTATEIAFLIPAYNYDLYRRFLAQNEWYRSYLPNKSVTTRHICSEGSSLYKKLCELFFSGWGNWCDDLLLRLTLKQWQKKFSGMSAKDFDLQFRSRKNACKRHNSGYQNKVLAQWQQKIKTLEQERNVLLS